MDKVLKAQTVVDQSNQHQVTEPVMSNESSLESTDNGH